MLVCKNWVYWRFREDFGGDLCREGAFRDETCEFWVGTGKGNPFWRASTLDLGANDTAGLVLDLVDCNTFSVREAGFVLLDTNFPCVAVLMGVWESNDGWELSI